MRYPMPSYHCDFEIPCDWLLDACLIGFAPALPAYHSTVAADHVPLIEIEPPRRLRTVPMNAYGFDRKRLLSVLKGFVAGDDIVPVELMKLETDEEFLHLPYGYRVYDGYHRFFASIAVGFTHLPMKLHATVK